MPKVTGFKATYPDMKCLDYQFSIGKHIHYGEVIPCNSGFHFCQNIEDTMKYYHYDEHCRIFEVIGSGVIKNHRDKTVCDEIEFVREVDYNTLADSPSWELRCLAAINGCRLDKLVHDEDIDVRGEVAKQGYGLDILINDEYDGVRATVAQQGYGLDVLINDESWRVRQVVASKGYGLDKLVRDENAYVRRTVALQIVEAAFKR